NTISFDALGPINDFLADGSLTRTPPIRNYWRSQSSLDVAASIRDFDPSYGIVLAELPPELTSPCTGIFSSLDGSCITAWVDTDRTEIRLYRGTSGDRFVGSSESSLYFYQGRGLFPYANLPGQLDDIGFPTGEERVEIDYDWVLYRWENSGIASYLVPVSRLGTLGIGRTRANYGRSARPTDSDVLAFNGDTSIPDTGGSGLRGSAAERPFLLDATVSEAILGLVSVSSGIAPEVTLTSPDGTPIDPASAEVTDGISYYSDTELGYAYYFLENPSVGTWHLEFNDAIEDPVVLSPVRSTLRLVSAFDSTSITAGEAVTLTIDLEGAADCSAPSVTSTLLFQSPSDTTATAQADIPLQPDGASFSSRVVLDEPGTYFARSSLTCGGSGAERVTLSPAVVVEGNATSNENPVGEEAIIPSVTQLTQNYPNPFNPSTTIRFGLTETTAARLDVVDLMGRQVAVLVDQPRAAGWHEVSFDATGLASGIYLYRLHTGDQIVTRKMLLLK
ncbi:MAG: T9SS type A sorting domain-containing protein, partial [Bacteroidota bacterium]